MSPPVALSFSSVYDRWFDEVVRWARAAGVPEADLDDVAQDVFVVVERKLAAFDGENIAGWLYRITKNASRALRRRAWFRSLIGRARDHELDSIADAAPDPATHAESRQRQHRLALAMRKLSEKRRSAFVLFEIEGYSGEEIASLEAIPIATVWTRLHHARCELAELLADERGE